MKKYIISLTDQEREQLEQMLSAGKAASRKLTRARIVLKADRNGADPEWTDEAISEALEVTPRTVAHVRQAFVEEGLAMALNGHSTRNHRLRKINGECEAHLIALLCQPAPQGHARWTLRLLADRLVKLEPVHLESVSHETVRQTLRTNDLKPWQQEEWCIPPDKSGEFVSRMEDVLDVYTQPEDPKHPMVCIDELSKQLVSETRVPLPLAPGQPRRYDYEYERQGTCNIYLIFAPFRGRRWVKVTDHRGYHDWAGLMRDLVDVHFPEADCITVVVDNLNVHVAGALYETFEPAEAKRILAKLEIHYTPKHGSWLNMAEIELRVLNGQCLDRRMGTVRLVEREVTAWAIERDATHATVDWRFTTAEARIKLKRLYPVPQPDQEMPPSTINPTGAKLGATEAAARARQRAQKRTRAKHVSTHRKNEA
jgi:hypothetical protein